MEKKQLIYPTSKSDRLSLNPTLLTHYPLAKWNLPYSKMQERYNLAKPIWSMKRHISWAKQMSPLPLVFQRTKIKHCSHHSTASKITEACPMKGNNRVRKEKLFSGLCRSLSMAKIKISTTRRTSWTHSVESSLGSRRAANNLWLNSLTKVVYMENNKNSLLRTPTSYMKSSTTTRPS